MSPFAPDEILVGEAVRFLSAGYRLEGELAYADGPIVAGVVIAGPHPLLGGTMNNNVVRSLADGLARRGFTVLRFNYRGTGASEGPRSDVEQNLAEFLATSHIPDEPVYANDLAAAVQFLRKAIGDSSRPALVGYSFGCSLLAAAAAPDIPLAVIAPTIGTHSYAAYQAIDNPLLVVASEEDFAVNTGQFRHWYDSLRCPRRLVQGHFDNHFFRGHERELAEIVFHFLEEHMGDRRCL